MDSNWLHALPNVIQQPEVCNLIHSALVVEEDEVPIHNSLDLALDKNILSFIVILVFLDILLDVHLDLLVVGSTVLFVRTFLCKVSLLATLVACHVLFPGFISFGLGEHRTLPLLHSSRRHLVLYLFNPGSGVYALRTRRTISGLSGYLLVPVT